MKTGKPPKRRNARAERARRKDESKPDLKPVRPARSEEDEDEAALNGDEEDPVRDSIRDGVEKARKEASWRWRDLLANMDSDETPSASKDDPKRNRRNRDT
jgi:ribosome-binding protein aMBF1 (putative translation factor)